MNNWKPEYIGIFLTPESRAELLMKFPAKFNKVNADHVTLIFRPTMQEIGLYTIGEQVLIPVIGYAKDDKGQAILVDISNTKNKNPHITISISDGTKAVYSNELLEKNIIEKVENFTLNGVIGIFGQDRNIHYSSEGMI